MNNHTSKSLKGIYAITDPILMGQNIITMAEQAILAGIKVLQYRNKTATPEQQLSEATTLAGLCKKHNVIFIVNDNVELAMDVNADGVHLGQQDTRYHEAREKLGKNKIIGVTCHNQLELALTAQQQGADYIAFGRFFDSVTKPSAPKAALTLLSDARSVISIPVVAIGGITHELAPALLKEGVDMLAVIQGIFGASDVFSATRQFVEIFHAHDTPRTPV